MLFEIIFLSLGILLIVSAAVRKLKNMQLRKTGIPVRATVVGIIRTNKAGKNKSHTLYHPVFEYRADGRPVKTQGPGATKVKYPVGSVLEIRYDAQKPERILVSESAAEGSIAPIWIGIALIAGSVLSMAGVRLPQLRAPAGYLLFAGLLLIFAMIIFMIVKVLRGAKDKFEQHALSEQMASNVLVAAKNEGSSIIFEFVNGNRVDYVVPESVYSDLWVGDWGNLTYQGSLFVRFERTYR